MKHCGIEVKIKNVPELDPGFIPLHRWNEEYLKTAEKPFAIAVERNNKQISTITTRIHGDEAHAEADLYHADRLVKFELWQKGGYRVYVKGGETLCRALRELYAETGARAFDAQFMGSLYQKEFEVIPCQELPGPYEIKRSIGGHFDGCRIGLDVGGSDYKVAAVIDGEAVYSKETVWNPKQNSDPAYHYSGITAGLRDAKGHLPRVDAIGVSSAGLFADNHLLAAQLFQKVPKDQFDKYGRDIYIRAIREVGGDIPFEVVNDGDVAALAGAVSMKRSNLLGLAMGTSFIGGFVEPDGSLSNWISELAFAPVDASPHAAKDDWTGDIGVGVQYFCQEAVIKLSAAAGIDLSGYDTPAKKLKAVQNLLDGGHGGAAAIFRSIGCYLGHTVPFYMHSYKADSVLLLGRVVSGKGGDIILQTANAVLQDEYPAVKVELLLPDEQTRRLGQAVAAASLPLIKN